MQTKECAVLHGKWNNILGARWKFLNNCGLTLFQVPMSLNDTFRLKSHLFVNVVARWQHQLFIKQILELASEPPSKLWFAYEFVHLLTLLDLHQVSLIKTKSRRNHPEFLVYWLRATFFLNHKMYRRDKMERFLLLNEKKTFQVFSLKKWKSFFCRNWNCWPFFP